MLQISNYCQSNYKDMVNSVIGKLPPDCPPENCPREDYHRKNSPRSIAPERLPPEDCPRKIAPRKITSPNKLAPRSLSHGNSPLAGRSRHENFAAGVLPSKD